MKKYIAIILVTIPVIIAGCGNEPINPELPTNNPIDNKILEKTMEDYVDLEKINEMNINDPNPAITTIDECISNCQVLKEDTGLISKETCKIGCWMEEARLTLDPTLCETKITDELFRGTCLSEIAKETKDASICEKIGKDNNDMLRAVCFMDIVEITKDASICEKLKDTIMHLGCIEALEATN